MRTGCISLIASSVFATLLATTARGEEEANTFVGAFDQSFVHASTPLVSWVDHGPGKLRFDESSDGALVPRAFVDYRGRITPTLRAHATVNANSDGDAEIGVTEAYLEYRPVPSSPWARRWRFGAFYPHVSLENAAAGCEPGAGAGEIHAPAEGRKSAVSSRARNLLPGLNSRPHFQGECDTRTIECGVPRHGGHGAKSRSPHKAPY